jgi:hypothetical protein
MIEVRENDLGEYGEFFPLSFSKQLDETPNRVTLAGNPN